MQMGQKFSRGMLARLSALMGLAGRSVKRGDPVPDIVVSHPGVARHIGRTDTQSSGTRESKRKHLRQIAKASRRRNRAV